MNGSIRFLVAVAVIAGTAALSVTSAQAASCLSGGAAGAVVGHVAGHHAVLGAVGGCIAGHEIRKNQEKQAQQTEPAGTSSNQ